MNIALWIFAGLSFTAVDQTPEGTVRSFVDAVNRKDMAAAAKLVKGGVVSPPVQSVVQDYKDWPKLSLEDLKATIVGNRCLVTFLLKSDRPADVPTIDECMVLIQEGSEWLIDVPGREDGVGLVAYFLSNPPLVRQAYAAKQTTICLSNVKQIALGLLIFSADNDDAIKATAANWQTKVKPYLKGTQVLTCPEGAKGEASYSLNTNLLNKSLSAVESQTQCVLVYEGKDRKLNFRHNGRATVAFVDGHAEIVTPERAKSLLWK